MLLPTTTAKRSTAARAGVAKTASSCSSGAPIARQNLAQSRWLLTPTTM